MKLISPNFSANSAALLAGLLLVPLGAQATQLAYEGFDYATGSGNLTTQNGGTGWNGAWQTVNNGSADVIASSLAAGASSPTGYDLRSLGNSSNLPNNRRVGRSLNTSTTGPFGSRGYRDPNGRIGADGTTLYLSFMQQPDGTSAYYEFEFHRGDLGDGGRIAGIGNDTGTTNVNLRAPNGTHSAIGAGSTAVNFYIVRIDFKPGNDDVYVYRNPTSATDPGLGAATLTKTAVADMSFSGVSLGAFNNGRTVAHDEIRFGTTWDDVALAATLAAPVFTSQPRATVNAYVGGSIGFTAVASAQPDSTYQWYKGATLLSGQTSSTLNLSNIQPGDAGAYHVVATNSQGSTPSNDGTVVVQTTPAGLLAYEGFDYNTGSTNMDGKFGGLGWGAAWAAVDNGGSNVLAGNLAAGTNAPNGYDAMSLSNSSFTPNAQRSGRLVDTTPGGRFGTAGYVDGNGNIGADGKTLYLSFMQQPDGTSKFYEFEFHRGNLGDSGRIGGVGNDTNNPVVNLRAPNNATSLIGPGSTGVNFYVVRIDFKSGPDDVYVYQNPISAFEPGTPTLIKTAVADMSFNGISLAAFDNGRTVKHDEIRLGQSWSDVVFGTSRLPLTWVGDGTSNNWNFADVNWNDGTGATQFTDGNPVTFSDSGSDTPAVNVTTGVSTGSVTVTGDTKSYSIGGSGTITCSGGLTKSGAGSLTLTGASNFSSAIIVSGGDLFLNGTTSVGSQLNLNGGTISATLGGTNTFTGTLFANAGTQSLSGTNSFAGIVTTTAATTITGPTSITGTGGTAVWIGNLAGANASLTVEPGGSLNITGIFSDAWVIGRDGGNGSVIQNGGTITYNSSNHPDAFIGASGAGGTVASYVMNGGTLEMSNTRLGLAIGPITSQLDQNGGTINVRQLELGSILTTGTGIYNLTSGTLNVGTDGITSAGGSGHYEINLKGGTIGAAADWSSPLVIRLINPVTFDSANHKITLSGGLTDFDTPTAAGGLVKTGSGTLALNGFNDYTGPTTISAGTLAGNGNQYSAVTVASGATIAPGDSAIGVFSCDTASLASGSTLAVSINSTSDSADELAAFGSDININGANLTFEEIGTGIVTVNTVLPIVEAVGTITGTFAGYPNGSTVTVGSNIFTLNYTSGQVTLTAVGTPYTNWADSKGLDGTAGRNPAFNADPDFDGVANGLEWILGGDPLAQDGGTLVTATGSGTNGLTLTFTREEASLGNATLIVQWDDNLDGIWTDVPVVQAGGSYANGVTVAVNQTATPDAVTVHIPASNAVDGKVFARLRATLP
ncbi:MAG: autotransporter-associated beta strand repeat-containing protein [Luteolibacter sp.]|uniref:beta strand repeat-containing protein n=1 Tax=Luteolibacter sp. TaxID=1962973 RepID=UPI003265B0E3